MICFRRDFDKLVDLLSLGGGNTFTTMYRQKILYYAAWLPAGELGTPLPTSAPAYQSIRFRDKFLSLKQDQVISMVKNLKKRDGISPWGVIVLFNTTEGGTTANAIPPIYIDEGFGIAR